jgi:hypothetical protein
VVRIPLGDGTVGWGRQLRSVRVELYSRFDAVDVADDVELDDLIGAPRAFTVSVMDSAFSVRSSWEVLDVFPLSPDEEGQTYKSFMQDTLSGALSLYWEAPDGTWGQDPATVSDCAGLERAAVWSASHVEDRLRDYRAGRPNKWVRPLNT